MKKLTIYILLCVLLMSNSFAQRDTTFPMETSRFDVSYDSVRSVVDPMSVYLQIHVSKSYIYGAKKILTLNDSSLIVQKNSKSHKLKLNSIRSVKFYDGTKFSFGLELGALIGFCSILGLYGLSNDSSITGFLTAVGIGVVAAIPCAVIGGIIGLFFEDSHSYNLDRLTTEKKKAKLIKLFREYR